MYIDLKMEGWIIETYILRLSAHLMLHPCTDTYAGMRSILGFKYYESGQLI